MRKQTHIKRTVQLIFTAALATLLTACFKTDAEKNEIADVACSIMKESIVIDGAERVREVNRAREEIGESAYLDGDSAIIESIQFGICRNLVRNDPAYDQLLASLKAEQNEILRKEEAAVRAKKQEKEAKWAAFQKELRERILADLEGVTAVKAYKAAIHNDDYSSGGNFILKHDCEKLEGLPRRLHVATEFKKFSSNSHRHCATAAGDPWYVIIDYYTKIQLENAIEATGGKITKYGSTVSSEALESVFTKIYISVESSDYGRSIAKAHGIALPSGEEPKLDKPIVINIAPY